VTLILDAGTGAEVYQSKCKKAGLPRPAVIGHDAK